MTPLEPIPAPWDGVVLVCRKCSKKLDGGFGPKGRQPLAKALRDGLKAMGRRRALRVVEVGCLSLCPKGAVTVVGPAQPGAVLVVPKRMEAREVLAALLPELATDETAHLLREPANANRVLHSVRAAEAGLITERELFAPEKAEPV